MLRMTLAVLAMGLLTACGQPTATREEAAPAAAGEDAPADMATEATSPTAAAVAPAAADSEAPVEGYSPPED